MRRPFLTLQVLGILLLAGGCGNPGAPAGATGLAARQELEIRNALHDALHGDETPSAAGRDRLIRIGPPAVPILLETLAADESLAAERPTQALRQERVRRGKLAVILGEIRDARAIPALLEHYDGPPFARALEKITGQSLGDSLGAWREWYVSQAPASRDEVETAVREYQRQGAAQRLQTIQGLIHGIRMRTGAAILEAQPDALLPAVQLQARMMSTEDLDRCRAARTLLVPAFRDPEPLVRRHAALLALQLGPLAVQPLRPLLRGGDPDTRLQVIQVLGEIGDGQAIPDLVAGLSDAAPILRQRSAWALGRIGDPVASTPLREGLLREPDPLVRPGFLAALVMVGEVGSFEELVVLLGEGADVQKAAADHLEVVCRRAFSLAVQHAARLRLPVPPEAWQDYWQRQRLGVDPEHWRQWWTANDPCPRALFLPPSRTSPKPIPGSRE